MNIENKIIHFIEPIKNKLTIWDKCRESWNIMNYEIMVWNDEDDIDSFMKEYYDDIYDIYAVLPKRIMKVNLARLCILHKFGGIYSDNDVFLYRDFTHLLNKDLAIIESKKDIYIENSLMVSTISNNMKLKQIIDRCASYIRETPISDLTVEHTGAKVLNKVVHDIDFQLLPVDVFNNNLYTYSHYYFTNHLYTNSWKSLDHNNDNFSDYEFYRNCSDSRIIQNLSFWDIDGYVEIRSEHLEEIKLSPFVKNMRSIKKGL